MVNQDNVKKFRDYFHKSLESALKDVIQQREKRESFVEEYPLGRLAKLGYMEYCIGTEQSKDGLCYKLEFGKYKWAGFGIGGGSAAKYGIYYHKANRAFIRGGKEIENIDELWPQFRDELMRFLYDSGKQESPMILDEYPLLQGMAMVLTKLLSLYYPEKYITIGSQHVLTELMEHFGFDYEMGMRCNEINNRFFKKIRECLPELNDYDGFVLGHIAWDYIDGEKVLNDNTNNDTGLGDDDVLETQYWIYAPGANACKWDECLEKGIMLLGWDELGDLSQYGSQSEIAEEMREIYGGNGSHKNDSHATWQFVHDIRPGDIIFVKRGVTEIIGRGTVQSDYEYDEEGNDYPNLRKVDWDQTGSWNVGDTLPMKTLTDITNSLDNVKRLKGLFDEQSDELVHEYPEYTDEDFLEDVYLDGEQYDVLTSLLLSKKNIILEGAPGVGKTFIAKRLAYSIMGVKDVNRVMMVQFHQSYSYEDFIMGFRPTEKGFELKEGAFYSFCKKASEDEDNDYFFIIDEINRGNLSKIFGELFMLIENDKRGSKNKIRLLYQDELFYVPENVYIIGMMNTADRSLAMLDYALRRRFAFYELKPAFDSEGFKDYQNDLDNQKFNKLIDCIKQLNDVISSDDSLGEGFSIGHSYFCNLDPDDIDDYKLSDIVEYEIIPMLKEYWFDEPSKVREWSDNLRSSIK